MIDVANAINWRHPLNRGLLVRYRCLPNQQRGVMWRDLRRRYDGTLTSGPEWRGPLKPNRAGSLYFDGVDDIVSSSETGTSEHTVSCWWKQVSTGNYGLWYFRQSGLIIPGAGTIVYQNGSTFETQNSNITASSGMSGQMVVTHLDDTSGGTKIYLDGVDRTGAAAVTKTNAVALTIGRAAPAFWFLNGQIDDVCIWNRALSASEVASLYRAQSSQRDPTLNWRPRRRGLVAGIPWAALIDRPDTPHFGGALVR